MDENTTPVITPAPGGEDDGKQPWESMTLWVSLVTMVLGNFPPAAAIIAANPGLVTAGIGTVFALLRLKTKKRVGK